MTIGKYRFAIGGMLFCASGINYMDRASIGILAPLFNRDLHLSPSRMGLIFSGFFIGYTLFAFVGGLLADRYGPRRVLSWSMGIWSVLCGLTGAAVGFVSLLVIRILFGFGEGPGLSTTNRTIINWFPRREAGVVVGTVLSGQMVGSAIAGPLVTGIALWVGWRSAFLVTGLIGLCWLACWRIFMTDLPAQNHRVSAGEAKLIERDRLEMPVATDAPVKLLSYVFRPGPIGVGIGLFAVNYTLYVLISWLPTYFTNIHHVEMKTMGALTAIPWVAGALGSIIGGLGSDLIFRRLKHPLMARKLSAWLPLLLSCLCVLLVNSAHSLWTAVLAITLALFFVSAAGQACWSITHELVPRRFVGSVGGFVHLLGNISGIVGPALTGMAIQYFGGFEVAFRLCSGVDAIAVLALLVLVGQPRNGTTAIVTEINV